MKKLLVIGAGFLQDFVICKAKSMGYETLTVDANPHAVGFCHADKHEVISITDECAVLDYARAERIDGVLTAATDYGVLAAARVARELELLGADYEAVRLIKNKHRVRECLYRAQADDSENSLEVTMDTDFTALSEHLTFPVMVKPCDGSGSRGVSRVDEARLFENACHLAISSSATCRATVEPFIVGREYGAESLVVKGNVHVLAIMKKRMTAPPYYAELGHTLPNDLSKEVEKKAKLCVENAIKALGINFGSVNMDLIITESGNVHIVDIGARMGGNLIGSFIIPYGTGIDYTANMIRNVMGDSVDLTVREHSAVATRLITFDKQREVKRLFNLEEVEKQYGVEIYHHLEIGQTVREYHTNLDGCGYIVARAETASLAERKADEALEYIREIIFTTD